MGKEKVSIREFSRRVGKSDTAIRDLISSGVITASAITKNENNDRPMLYYEAAKQMFDNYYGSVVVKVKKSDVKIPSVKKTSLPKKPKDTEEIIPEEPAQNTPTEENVNSKAAIDRMRSKVQLQVALLDLKQKQGQLVDKDKVYKSLFELGQQMSQSLLAIPDKYLDNILACKTRNEAHILLRNAISDALTQISELKESDLNFNRNTI